ncbi:MAG: N(G),N(G)-dimethylarginine dimethylaminohydrolase [Bacteroidetes bacterium HGW-Bacteroidetes-1]|jgi:dimethylargininase|nr:MAG: N(G),N(G)-dimethylarginine dimethylaminohydrolase [Bacteroidetes bacterium HGW-Bacteroidetes-1]
MRKYTHAIVRKPGKNFAEGITHLRSEKPSFEKALLQHQAYCDALKSCGLTITKLDADERYPDGCFVEDVAVITENSAVITRSGVRERQGEVEEIAKILSNTMKTEAVLFPGTLEGGDVVRAENHYYIGISARTNEEGAKQLSKLLEKQGFTVSTVPVEKVLHLKTGITYLGNRRFISTTEFAEAFNTYQVIHLHPDEEYAANCLLINDFILIPSGFSIIKTSLNNLGHQVIEVEMSEFRKMNGGLTCLSLLF